MPKITKQTMGPAVQSTGNSFIDGIVPVADIPPTGKKVLITGPSGTGKTTLGCDFPKPLCLIRPDSVENGSLSVVNVSGVFATPQMTEDSQLDVLVDYQRRTKHYKTIFLDGLQFYQDLVLKRVVNLKEIPAQLSWGIATQQDWGTVANEFKEKIRNLLRLAEDGTHVVMSGGERTINAEEGSVIAPSIVVALTPSSAGWINFVSDYIITTFIRPKMKNSKIKIGDMEMDNQERDGDEMEWCARTKPTDVYMVKFRVPKGTKLPGVMVDPTWEKLNKLMQGVAK